MKSKFIKLPIILISLSFPFYASAQATFFRTKGILDGLATIVSGILIPLAFTLSLLYFFWGVAKYIKSEGDGKAEGKNVMIWGIVALFVISSVWGLVAFVRGELGVGQENVMVIPNVGP